MIFLYKTALLLIFIFVLQLYLKYFHFCLINIEQKGFNIKKKIFVYKLFIILEIGLLKSGYNK